MKLNTKKMQDLRFEIGITLATTLLLVLAFIPIFTMLLLSMKSNVQIYGDFFSLPNPIEWSNYSVAIGKLIPNMINTLLVVSIATACTMVLSVLCVLALMMVPGILTLIPQYSLIQSYRLYNTWGALIFPWVAGGQVFGIILCHNYMQGLPGELFESARLDGCGEVRALFYVAIPLSKPIIATIVVMKMIDFYNDFIWPLLAIESNSKQVISVAIRVFQASTSGGNVYIGTLVAGFVVATIPLFLLFLFTSRLYMEGLTAGAVKG